MRTDEVDVPTIEGPGLLRRPDPNIGVRGGLVALHGAGLPQRDQPLFEHLARTLSPLGFAVLSYDRRGTEDGDDTPLEIQAEDALAAAAMLEAAIGAPVGVFGFSQGAWAAAVAAAKSPEVAWLAVVGCSGVSPGAQMRFYTDELLRRGGYSTDDRAELLALRVAVEDVLRGAGSREHAAELLAAAVERPWFPLIYLPPELPGPEVRWHDMDYDPEPTFAQVTCPVLLMYGDDEECVPAPESKAVWRRATEVSGNRDLTIVDLPGSGHVPMLGLPPEDLHIPLESINPAYTKALHDWFEPR